MIIDFSVRPPGGGFDAPLKAPGLRAYNEVYANVQQGPGGKGGQTFEELVEELARNDVVAVIRGQDTETTMGFKIPNELVAETVRAHPDRFIGFAGIDPRKGARAVEELEYAVRELGLRGLNLQLFENEMCANDRLLYPVYAKCVELGIVANLHSAMHFGRGQSLRFGHPLNLDDVAIDFPDLKIVAAPPGFPWVLELIAVAWRHPNVHIAVSAVRPKYLAKPGTGYEPLVTYGDSILQDRMIFGSGYPLLPVERSIQEVRELPLKESVKEKWLFHNAARLLGLDAGSAGTP